MLRKGFFEIAGISRAIRRTEPRTVRKCVALQRAGKLHPRVSGPGPFFLTGECRKIWEIFWHFMPLRHCIKVQKLV